MSEAVIIDSIGNVLAFSEFVFEYTYTEIPPKFYSLANRDEIVIVKEDDSNKMRAFIKLPQYIDAYLLITIFVDQRVLNAIKSTSIAVSDYQSIEIKQFDIKISFIVIFLLITLILLFTSLIKIQISCHMMLSRHFWSLYIFQIENFRNYYFHYFFV